jgi:undecaprenyl-diphosphatase
MSIQSLDTVLLTWLRAFHAPWLDLLMSALTISGIMAGIWQLVALLSLFTARHRAAAFRALLVLWLGLVVVDVFIKPAIGRIRPVRAADAVTMLAMAQDAEARGLAPSSDSYSFPSGHAVSAFAGAIAIGRVWPQARVAWWVLAILISYSRIYLGHHYVTDVIGGALIGTALAFWVLGGRHRATYVGTLPQPLPAGVIVRP